MPSGPSAQAPAFTRGPWHSGNVRGGFLEVHCGDDDDTPICTIHVRRTVSGDRPNALANLALIFAAPDLHDALLVQIDATHYDYAWHKADDGAVIAEIEARYPFLVDQPREKDARIHMLREHAARLSAAALAKVRTQPSRKESATRS